MARRKTEAEERIAVVGVDGSGKTVLMAALGEMYERPDENGYFLSADDSRTFHTVKAQIDRMRKGAWPNATDMEGVTSLNWTLCKRDGKRIAKLVKLSFADYAGEVYRLAFGEHAEDELAPYRNQVEALRDHIRSADMLLVLVNLKDIIDGNLASAKTCETMWLTKEIIDLAFDDQNVFIPDREVALVFTQAAKYQSVIDESGGLGNAYRKYLPHVESLYPELKLLSVSVVDKTVVDSNGFEVPAEDFASTGLSDIFRLITEKTGSETSPQHVEAEQQKHADESPRDSLSEHVSTPAAWRPLLGEYKIVKRLSSLWGWLSLLLNVGGWGMWGLGILWCSAAGGGHYTDYIFESSTSSSYFWGIFLGTIAITIVGVISRSLMRRFWPGDGTSFFIGTTLVELNWNYIAFILYAAWLLCIPLLRVACMDAVWSHPAFWGGLTAVLLGFSVIKGGVSWFDCYVKGKIEALLEAGNAKSWHMFNAGGAGFWSFFSRDALLCYFRGICIIDAQGGCDGNIRSARKNLLWALRHGVAEASIALDLLDRRGTDCAGPKMPHEVKGNP